MVILALLFDPNVIYYYRILHLTCKESLFLHGYLCDGPCNEKLPDGQAIQYVNERTRNRLKNNNNNFIALNSFITLHEYILNVIHIISALEIRNKTSNCCF